MIKDEFGIEDFVASFTDAWIETFMISTAISAQKSHLLQMRGLKLMLVISLKRKKVASFTDAWIETKRRIMQARRREVASFTDAWIETAIALPGTLTHRSHLLQMRGLKQVYCMLSRQRHSRIFYRCVD